VTAYFLDSGFLIALAHQSDKRYSLTDCAFFVVMKRRRIKTALDRNALQSSHPRAHSGASHFITGIKNLQFELPALKAHQHAAEIFPRDLPTIDNDEWHTTIFGIVPLYSPPHRIVGNLETMPIDLLEVPDGKRSTYFLDQPTQQGEQIVFGIADHLEPIAGGVPFSKLKGFQRDNVPKQACPEMELV